MLPYNIDQTGKELGMPTVSLLAVMQSDHVYQLLFVLLTN